MGTMSEPLTRAELTIDLGAVARNWSRLNDITAGAETAAMVKSDGYGTGAVEAAGVLCDAGCREFFVADVAEAVALRRAHPDVDIVVLAGAPPGTLDDLVRNDLIPVLLDLGQLERWTGRARAEGRKLRASIHLDTGMNRTGFDRQETERLIGDLTPLESLDIVHVMSHLASADDPETDQNTRQLAAFQDLRSVLAMGRASLANTPGIALGPAYHFDHVRPGVGLYGADPSPDRSLDLHPVVHLAAPVLQVRSVRAGDTVGYGATHTVAGERRVATVAVGYGDGFFRSQSGRGHVAFDGEVAPIVGRVSMDLITVDITDLPAEVAVVPGTAAELIGATVTIDDVAEAAETIPYEVLTALGHRYRRRHIR